MIRFVLESVDDLGFYLGMAVVFVPLFVAFLILRRKKLFFEVVCEAKLLGVEGSGLQHVTSDDCELMLFVVDLRNAVGSLARVGGVDIASAQYQSEEIAFSFGEDAHVLEAGVLESPSGIEAKVHVGGSQKDEAVLKAASLNRGDVIRLKAVVKNPTKAEPEPLWVGGGVRYTVEVEGQIRGIRQIQRKWDSQKLLIYAFLAGLLGVVLDYSVVGWVRGLISGDRAWFIGPPFFWACRWPL